MHASREMDRDDRFMSPVPVPMPRPTLLALAMVATVIAGMFGLALTARVSPYADAAAQSGLEQAMGLMGP